MAENLNIASRVELNGIENIHSLMVPFTRFRSIFVRILSKTKSLSIQLIQRY